MASGYGLKDFRMFVMNAMHRHVFPGTNRVDLRVRSDTSTLSGGWLGLGAEEGRGKLR